MNKSSCRYAINRAKRDGVKIKINQNYEDFNTINISFRENKKLLGSLQNLSFLKKYGILFVSEYNGEIIGGQFYIKNENYMRWLIGASKRLEVDEEKATLIGNANRLMVWQAINYAKEKGIKEFDMGGYYTGKKKDSQKERINNFKRSFGGELVIHYNYEKYYSRVCELAFKVYNLSHKFLNRI
jgi:lipid II:glycine glycyltransferase (peptidoglycan interpeptide bridge formation enzyme)